MATSTVSHCLPPLSPTVYLHPLDPQPAKLVGSPIVEDDDFAGPLLLCLVLGVLLLFKGKVHFGTIYGVFVIGAE